MWKKSMRFIVSRNPLITRNWVKSKKEQGQYLMYNSPEITFNLWKKIEISLSVFTFHWNRPNCCLSSYCFGNKWETWYSEHKVEYGAKVTFRTSECGRNSRGCKTGDCNRKFPGKVMLSFSSRNLLFVTELIQNFSFWKLLCILTNGGTKFQI